MLAGGIAAAGGSWIAPSILGLDRAAAARSSHIGECEIPRLERQVEWLDKPPPTTEVGGPLQHSKVSFMWQEQGPCELEDDLRVDRVSEGNWFGNHPPEPAFIEKGTCVCSYFIHGDHLETSEFTATARFGASAILGIIYQNATLVASAALEAPGTSYVYYKMDAKDEMGFDGAGAFKWSMIADEPKNPDQVRLIVSCGRFEGGGGDDDGRGR